MRLAELGLLGKARTELLSGRILVMTAQSMLHVKGIECVARRLRAWVGDRGLVITQSTVRLTSEDMPEPDVTVLARPLHELEELPGASDIRLLIEVSLTSLELDQGLKARLYAGAGVPEYWVVNLQAREVAVYRDPAPDGYRDIRRLPEGGHLAPLDAPDEAIAVGELLP